MRLRPGQLWKCPKGHVLGMIIRNGSGRPMLALYRNAMEEEPNPSPLPLAAPQPHDGGAKFAGSAEAAGKGNERTPSCLPPDGGSKEVDVMGVVDLQVGTVHDIRCSICGAMKPWVEKGEKEGQ